MCTVALHPQCRYSFIHWLNETARRSERHLYGKLERHLTPVTPKCMHTLGKEKQQGHETVSLMICCTYIKISCFFCLFVSPPPPQTEILLQAQKPERSWSQTVVQSSRQWKQTHLHSSGTQCWSRNRRNRTNTKQGAHIRNQKRPHVSGRTDPCTHTSGLGRKSTHYGGRQPPWMTMKTSKDGSAASALAWRGPQQHGKKEGHGNRTLRKGRKSWEGSPTNARERGIKEVRWNTREETHPEIQFQ